VRRREGKIGWTDAHPTRRDPVVVAQQARRERPAGREVRREAEAEDRREETMEMEEAWAF
jgi:hypothetical protein